MENVSTPYSWRAEHRLGSLESPVFPFKSQSLEALVNLKNTQIMSTPTPSIFHV